VHDLHLAALCLPEPQRRCQQLADELIQGRSVVWVMPRDTESATMLGSVLERCRQSGLLRYEQFDLISGCGDSPAIQVADRWGLADSISPSRLYRELHTSQALPELLVLEGLAQLPEADVAAWVRFVRAWVDAARTVGSATTPKALLVPVDSWEIAVQFSADTYLAISWLWGWVGVPEVMLLARSLSRERGLAPDASLWVQSVYTHLAGGDIECLAWLVDRGAPPIQDDRVHALLVEYAEHKGWGKHLLNGQRRIAATSSPYQRLAPPESLRPLWHVGAVDDNDGHPKFHAALLAAAGRRRDIRCQVWAAQASCLLPLMDRWRLNACDKLASTYSDWSRACAQDELATAVSGGATAVEFADMDNFLANPRLRPPADRELKRRTTRLRHRRNQLAHCVPLSWEEFQEVCTDCR
jgi:hypothetical protein